MFARGYAFMTGFNTTFVLFRWHHVSFPFSFYLFLFQRTSHSQIHCTHIAPGGGFAMGYNPTVDDGRIPPAENGSYREMYFVAWSEFHFSLVMRRVDRSARGARSSPAAIPRSVRARAMGNGFSIDPVAVQAILDARSHFFVHLV